MNRLGMCDVICQHLSLRGSRAGKEAAWKGGGLNKMTREPEEDRTRVGVCVALLREFLWKAAAERLLPSLADGWPPPLDGGSLSRPPDSVRNELAHSATPQKQCMREPDCCV